jgi:hypothetical protein
MSREAGAAPSSSPAVRTKSANKIYTTRIVGVSVGGAAFVGLCATQFFFIGCNKSLKEVVRRHNEGTVMKPVEVGEEHAEGVYRQSTYFQAPLILQGEYPQTFGSPHMSMSGVQYYS